MSLVRKNKNYHRIHCAMRNLQIVLINTNFFHIADVLAGADVTIMEEGTELIHRLKDFITKKPGAAPLPMFTSCCPGWIEFVEKCSPEYIPHISTAKSPHMMQGSLLKAFFSDLIESPEEKLRVVSIMPCVRKVSSRNCTEKSRVQGL